MPPLDRNRLFRIRMTAPLTERGGVAAFLEERPRAELSGPFQLRLWVDGEPHRVLSAIASSARFPKGQPEVVFLIEDVEPEDVPIGSALEILSGA